MEVIPAGGATLFFVIFSFVAEKVGCTRTRCSDVARTAQIKVSNAAAACGNCVFWLSTKRAGHFHSLSASNLFLVVIISTFRCFASNKIKLILIPADENVN